MKVYSCLVTLLLGLLIESSQGGTTWTLESKLDVCTLFPNGATLRKPGTCDETIYCQDGVSTPGEKDCTGTQGYKLDTMKCGAVTDAYCSTPCEKSSPEWVSGVRNCFDWSKCDGKTEVTQGTCPSGQVFSSTENRCHYKESGYKCDKVYDICNIAPKDQKYWDEFNCHKYFYCDKSQKQQTGECATGTYYDRLSGDCIHKPLVDCYKHPFPENVCGNAKLAIRDRFVKDQATCGGYFYCKDLGSSVPDTAPIWGQCADKNFFDESIQGCRDRTMVACAEDRCDGRASGLELSPIAGCQHYLECLNGYTMQELKCPDDLYFDANIEMCVETKISYPICS